MKSTNAVENIIEKNKNIRFTVKQKKNKDKTFNKGKEKAIFRMSF